jgi:beta-lactamase regulating signal transducer with metallopeptidase domain
VLPAGNWPAVLFALWALVACYMLCRVGRGVLHLRRLRRDCTPVGPACQSHLSRLLDAHGSGRSVKVCYSPLVSMPMVAGLFRPTIIFPERLAGLLTDEEFDQIVLHEMAHVRRMDAWTNLAQKLIEAAFFFNPAALWLGRRLNLEREVACDDWVISVTEENRSYVACLTKLVEFSVTPQYSVLAPHAAAGKKQIFSRVESLLQRKRGHDPHLSRFAASAACATLLATALCIQAFVPSLALAKGGAAREWPSRPSQADEANNARNFAREGEGGAPAGGAAAEEASAPRTKGRAASGPEAAGVYVEAAAHASTPASYDITVEKKTAAEGDATAARVPQQERSALPAPQSGGDAAGDLLGAIAALPNDFEKAKVLIEVVNVAPAGKVPSNLFAAAATIDSAWERARVMSAILERGGVGRPLMIRVLKFSATIDSDVPKTNLLVQAIDLCPADDEVFAAYLASAASIKSATWKERAVSALLRREGLSGAVLTQAIEMAADGMGSRRSGMSVMEAAMQNLSK